jgi:CheY-like chemotaxis protein
MEALECNSDAKQRLPTILVVDDERHICRMCVTVLEGAGYAAVEAYDGQEALDWMAANPAPDVVVCDVMMPRVDGFQVAERRLQDPRLADVPFVLLTSMPSDISAYRNWKPDGRYEHGIETWLYKPFQGDGLIPAVEWSLSDRSTPPPEECRLSPQAAVKRSRLRTPAGQAEERRRQFWRSLLPCLFRQR